MWSPPRLQLAVCRRNVSTEPYSAFRNSVPPLPTPFMQKSKLECCLRCIKCKSPFIAISLDFIRDIKMRSSTRRQIQKYPSAVLLFSNVTTVTPFPPIISTLQLTDLLACPHLIIFFFFFFSFCHPSHTSFFCMGVLALDQIEIVSVGTMFCCLGQFETTE